MSTHEKDRSSSSDTPNSSTSSTAGGNGPTAGNAATSNFTSGSSGGGHSGPEDFTSNGHHHCRPHIPEADFDEDTAQTSGGFGGPKNEAMPEPDIEVKVRVVRINGADGDKYEKLTANQLSWSYKDGIADPVYVQVLRDGNLLTQTDKWATTDPHILRDTKYSYKVRAFNAMDQPYAESPTVHYTTPKTLELDKCFKSIALVPVRFGDTQTPQQPVEVYEEFFNVMHDLYEEMSYGKFNFESTILPLATLDMNQADFCTQQDEGGYGRSCDRAAIRFAALDKLGVKDEDYDGYVFCMNGIGGSGWNGERYCDFADHNLNTYDMAHEFGHMLGTWHADSWTCPNDDLVGPSVENIYEGGCTVSTYGDQLSIMGAGNLRHMHSLHKENVGWLEPSQILVVDQAGTYELSALEAPGTAPVMIKIKLNGISEKIFYFLEYVKPIGFDSEPLPQATASLMNAPELGNQSLEGILVRLRFDQVAGGNAYNGNGESAIIKTIVREGHDFEDIERNLTIKWVAFKPGNVAEIQILGDF